MSVASQRFQRIGLIAKTDDPRLTDTVRTLTTFLHDLGREVIADTNAGLVVARIPVVPLAEFGDRCDLALIVGGDGTLLSAARHLVDQYVPLVGINLGRLGFMVDISPDHMLESVAAILAGNYVEDRRFLLAATVGDQQPVLAFNDVVLHKWNVARMIEFETAVDGQLIDLQRSDGLIISTPTGSTAYALDGNTSNR